MLTIKQISFYLQDETLSEKYLLENGILKTFSSCPSCKSTHVGRVRRQRYKCYECKYEWNIRRDSVLEGSHLKLSDFIGCIKMFVDEYSASKCANELNINRNSVGELYRNFQEKLISPVNIPSIDSGIINVILKLEDRKIYIVLDNSDSVEEGSRLFLSRSKDRDNAYRYLVSYKNLKVKKLLNKINRIDVLDDFYHYCRERLLTFRNRDENQLIWKLYELAFRYNHRHEDIFDLLLTKLSKYSIPG